LSPDKAFVSLRAMFSVSNDILEVPIKLCCVFLYPDFLVMLLHLSTVSFTSAPLF